MATIIGSSVKESIATDYLQLPDEALLAQCQVNAYKASGPGGQHRNKVSSAIRLYHPPTGVTAICNDSRNQHQNKRVAVQRLRAKIACQVRRPVELAHPAVGETVASCIFAPKLSRSAQRDEQAQAKRLQVGRRDHRYWAVVQFLLDLLEACGGRLAEAAELLGISTSNFTSVLRDDHAAFAAAAEIRKRHGHGPLK